MDAWRSEWTRILSTSAESDDTVAVSHAESKSLEAFLWGLGSASSLVFGAALGIVRMPSKVVRASLMAFGGGALIEALSIELFAHILAKARGGGHNSGAGQEDDIDRELVFLALGCALCGGLLFATLDRALSHYGAFLRKASTVQTYMGRLRYALTRRLIARLQQVPMFEVLSEHELHRLCRSMVKERYDAGDVIFREIHSDSSIFFLLSGQVELTLTTRYPHSALEYDRSANAAGSPLGLDIDDLILAMPRQSSPDNTELEAEVKDCFLLGPNDIFGETSLFSCETIQAQAVAKVASSVLRIPSNAMHRLLASNQSLQDFIAMIAVDRLRESDVFCRCTPSTVARLVSFMKQAEFQSQDVLFRDVDEVCPIYYVVLGQVEVCYGSCEKGEPIRRLVAANELLGTEHLVTGSSLHATAVALERTTVLIIQRRDIDKLCEHDERFKQALLSSGRIGAQLSGQQEVALVPQEGMSAPVKFGLTTFEELYGQLKRHENGDGSPKSATSASITSQQAAPALKGSAHDAVDEDLLATEDLPDLLVSAAAAAAAGDRHTSCAANVSSSHGGGMQAAIMIWLGILIDSVPESVVMGILVNTSSRSSLITFVCGVFLANFPEAMSSAGTMAAHGMRKFVIIFMWASIMFCTGLGAYIGALLFPPGSRENPAVEKVIAGIEGLCGGAMLCMIANTVLPEAFEQGGNVTGLSALLGFLVAIAISVIL
jgi:CRP-like cAMP-binding protein/zinc transporter ZupT